MNFLKFPSLNEALSILRDEYDKWKEDCSGDAEVVGVEGPSGSDEHDLFGILADAPATLSEKSEIDEYMNEQRCPSKTNPLRFWECNANRFKVLSKIARKYLAVPASSAGAERVFSVSGWLGRARRSSLTPKNVSRLLMIREEIEPRISKVGSKRKIQD